MPPGLRGGCIGPTPPLPLPVLVGKRLEDEDPGSVNCEWKLGASLFDQRVQQTI